MIAENPLLSDKIIAPETGQKNDEKSMSDLPDNDSSANEYPFKMKPSKASDKVFEEKPLIEKETMNFEDYSFCYFDGIMHFVKLPESE